MDGRPNRRNKAALSNFSGLVWTLSKCAAKILTLNYKQKNLSVNECNRGKHGKSNIHISFFDYKVSVT